ncbi:hypothetical protein GG804_26095 [Sphingomonas histidinilytica]|uniref:hypothetical protein n=1 Tax=Rhizorhabdus histidinilytica TaxID=439228 RepID=UPI000F77687F|nr:hypothetical protein [Rhizorhabdus histidinilytica]MBO9380241.1 hypothetical protein [Rhizorhabdus histidinilytica]QEH81191.1 hypothetical protein EIK56_25145 [Sphingomonas sp. C8-2]
MAYDITQQALLDTAPIHLKSAAGEYLYHDGKPMRIVLYGPGSEQFARVEARQTQRAMKRMQDNDGKITVPAKEIRDAEQAEDLAEITHSFENFTYPGFEAQGTPMFKAFYGDPKMTHFHKQVTKSLTDAGNWQPGSAGN